MLRYHIIQYMAIASTKLVRIKQNPPLRLQSTPRGTQGFGKAGDFRYPTLMRFFERPGGFRWCYYTTNRAKRKAASSGTACRSTLSRINLQKRRYNSKTLDRINSISHIQHFINAFQPVAYRRPAVMCLRRNVRQWKPFNVPQ